MAQKQREPRRKHVPQRTCIACREVAGKRGLIRLVRMDGGVEVDLSGKQPGRGAYIHPVQSCWQNALSANRVEQALRTRLSKENRKTLADFAATLQIESDEETEPG